MRRNEASKTVFQLIRNIEQYLLYGSDDQLKLEYRTIETETYKAATSEYNLALRVAIHLNRSYDDYVRYELNQIRAVFRALLDEVSWTGLKFTDAHLTDKTIVVELLSLAYRLKRPYSKMVKRKSCVSFEDFDDLFEKYIKEAVTVRLDKTLAGVLHRFIENLYDTVFPFLSVYEDFVRDYSIKDFLSRTNAADIYHTVMCGHCNRLYIDKEHINIYVDGNISHLCDHCKAQTHPCDVCGTLTFRSLLSSSKQETKEFWSTFRTNKEHTIRNKGVIFCGDCASKYLSSCFCCGGSLLVTPVNTLNYEKGDVHACHTCRNPAKDTITCAVAGCSNTFSKMHRKEIQTHMYHGSNTSDHSTMLFKYCDKHIAMLSAVHPYGYRPDKRVFMLHPKEVRQPNKLLLGFELEFQACSPDVRRIIASELIRTTGYNKFTVCLDSSVQSGAEIISAPFSFMFYKKRKKLFKDLWNMVVNNGGTFVDPHVGFHVHTSKNAWSSTQVYKLVKFLQNKEEYAKLVTIFGRSTGQYNFISESDLRGVVKVARDKQNLSKQHYNNINMTGNHTIEFRMFAGPASVIHLLAYLEFCFAVYDWTAQAKSNELEAEHFINFVVNSKLYGNLRKLMLSKYTYLKGDCA